MTSVWKQCKVSVSAVQVQSAIPRV